MNTKIIRYDLSQYENIDCKETCALAADGVVVVIETTLPPGAATGDSTDARCLAMLRSANAAIQKHLDRVAALGAQ